MIPSFKQSSSGFSLVELMIGIVVLAIAMAVAMPSYSQWIQNTHIRNAAESIQNGMQRARAEAVIRNANVTFVLGGGASWTVTDTAAAQVIETKTNNEISGNVSVISVPAASTTITFSNLGGVTANADASATITSIDIDSAVLAATDSRNLQITVGIGGIVRMCDPNVPVAVPPTDPRQCY